MGDITHPRLMSAGARMSLSSDSKREFLEGSAHPHAPLPDLAGTYDGTSTLSRWPLSTLASGSRLSWPGPRAGPRGLLALGLLNGETFAIWGFNTCFLLAGGPSRSALASGDHHPGRSPMEGLRGAQDSPK